MVTISQDLTLGEEKEILSFLDKNNDVFAWRTSDLIGVSRDIIEHKLEVNSSARPKKQRLFKMSDEKVVATKAEIQRLLDAGFIHEVYYPSWLANIVMVKKKNGKWRMCTDFTDLKKSCPKDDFPLARIDKVVDSVAGCEIMSLLDYFQDIIRYGSGRKTKRRQASSHPSAPTAILGCPKVSRTPDKLYAG
jgi:hypothetical protein